MQDKGENSYNGVKVMRQDETYKLSIINSKEPRVIPRFFLAEQSLSVLHITPDHRQQCAEDRNNRNS